MQRVTSRRGMALAIVIFTALVFSVAAYAVLYLSLGLRERADFHKRNIKARYASEAGIVWAMQRLWQDPTWSSPEGNVDLPFDVDTNGTIGPNEGVDVIMPPCAAPPCLDRPLQAKVRY